MSLSWDVAPPTVDPTASPEVLWPPNGKLRDVTVLAHAFDASGIADLEVTVATCEPPDDSDIFVDSVDVEAGVIELRLRAERLGTAPTEDLADGVQQP